MQGNAQFLAQTDRQALLQAVAALGAAADFLANGALIVTVPSLGSAQDQATRAARAALIIKGRWPQAVVSMATGRGAIRGRTAVGEVVEVAARSLKTGNASEVAMQLLPVGSLGWCRAIDGGIHSALNSQDLARMSELLALLLSTEPAASARASYCETIMYVGTVMVAGAPATLLQALLGRLVETVELAVQTNPLIRRYLHTA